MKKILLLSILAVSLKGWSKEFNDLQNVLNGSCKDHKNIISEYVGTGSLDEKTNIAGERTYKNFFKQGRINCTFGASRQHRIKDYVCSSRQNLYFRSVS